MYRVNKNRSVTLAFFWLGLCAAWLLPLPYSAGGAARAQPKPDAESTSHERELSDASEADHGRGWIASFAIQTGASVQDWSGTNQSVLLPGGVLPAEMIRESASGDDLDASPFVAGSIEVMTPELPIPTTPRFFIGAEVAPAFGFDRTLSGEGDAGAVASPLLPGQSLVFGEDLLLGQGTETSAEMGDLMWGAHAGIAFPVDVYGRRLRIKPSIGWISYEVDFSGLVSDAECVTVIPPSDNCNANATSEIRALGLEGSTSETFHALGPALDLELETFSAPNYGSSIYVGFRSYRVLSDTKVEFQATETFNDGIGTGDIATATFTGEVDDWMIRLLVGFKLEWRGIGAGSGR